MKRVMTACGLAAVIACGQSVLLGQGQGSEHAAIVIPASSVEKPGEHGVAAHTNHLLRVSPHAKGSPPAPVTQPPSWAETPASLATVYGLTGALGGTNTIVIVDAYHYPTALNDFNVFSSQFGLPTEPSTDPLNPNNNVFQVVYASGKAPRTDCGWSQEASLDIQWAHAMAPGAKIVLVEAKSNWFIDLFKAVDVGSSLPNARALSMSWGSSEFSSETDWDSHLNRDGVVYFSSSGDSGGATIYPGVSPYVISAGGTRINRDYLGNFLSETAWTGSGGGPSLYEPRPSHQDIIQNVVGTQRGVPDYSFDADPNSGVAVYDSTPCDNVSGWIVLGGTSVASPALAGIVTSAGGNVSTAAELALLYQSVLANNTIDNRYFNDILIGAAGSFSAKTWWDFVTGIGSTRGLTGK